MSRGHRILSPGKAVHRRHRRGGRLVQVPGARPQFPVESSRGAVGRRGFNPRRWMFIEIPCTCPKSQSRRNGHNCPRWHGESFANSTSCIPRKEIQRTCQPLVFSRSLRKKSPMRLITHVIIEKGRGCYLPHQSPANMAFRLPFRKVRAGCRLVKGSVVADSQDSLM
jgi:hypothetical protein